MEKGPPIVFWLKDGENLSMQLGYLWWHGGVPHATADPDYWGDSDKAPKPIPLDPRQIERDPNAAEGEERYIHRGHVVLQR